MLDKKQYNKIFELSVDFNLTNLISAVLSTQDEDIIDEAENFLYNTYIPRILQETQEKNSLICNNLFEEYEDNCIEKYERIKEAALNEWIEKIEGEIEELTSERKLKANFERVNSEISREYLVKQLNKNSKDNLELVAVKLCVKLEATLRCLLKNNEDDLLMLINKHDANENHKKLLHRLRMYRNSIAHADGASEQLTQEELLKCTEIIVELTEGA